MASPPCFSTGVAGDLFLDILARASRATYWCDICWTYFGRISAERPETCFRRCAGYFSIFGVAGVLLDRGCRKSVDGVELAIALAYDSTRRLLAHCLRRALPSCVAGEFTLLSRQAVGCGCQSVGPRPWRSGNALVGALEAQECDSMVVAVRECGRDAECG